MILAILGGSSWQETAAELGQLELNSPQFGVGQDVRETLQQAWCATGSPTAVSSEWYGALI